MRQVLLDVIPSYRQIFNLLSVFCAKTKNENDFSLFGPHISAKF